MSKYQISFSIAVFDSDGLLADDIGLILVIKAPHERAAFRLFREYATPIGNKLQTEYATDFNRPLNMWPIRNVTCEQIA